MDLEQNKPNMFEYQFKDYIQVIFWVIVLIVVTYLVRKADGLDCPLHIVLWPVWCILFFIFGIVVFAAIVFGSMWIFTKIATWFPWMIKKR